MTRTEIFEKIKEIIKTQFNGFEVKEETMFRDIPGWDSLGHMAFLGNIQQTFGIKFSFEQVVSLNGVKNVIDCLEQLV